MYTPQKLPDAKVPLPDGSHFNPIITLKDEHGDKFHVRLLGGYFILYGHHMGASFSDFLPCTHWFVGAAKALAKYLSSNCG